MSVDDELTAVLQETNHQLRYCRMPNWRTAHPQRWYTSRWIASIQRYVEVPAPWLQFTHYKLLPLLKRWWSDSRSPCVAASAYDHARRHCLPDTKFVVLADIKGFFSSITRQHLIEYLFHPTGLAPENAELLARLCAPLSGDKLLTGAPISPIIADQALHSVDYLLEDTAYSRYVDDLAFSIYDDGTGYRSTERSMRQACAALLETVRVVLHPRFKLNERKTRVWAVGEDKTVKITGYIVEPGHLPRAPRSAWRKLRAGLYRLGSELNNTTAKPSGWAQDLQHLRGLFSFCAETDEDKAAPYKALLETLENHNWPE